MSLLEEQIHKTFGRVIIKEEKGENSKALLDKVLVLKVLAFLSPSLLLLLWEVYLNGSIIDADYFRAHIESLNYDTYALFRRTSVIPLSVLREYCWGF